MSCHEDKNQHHSFFLRREKGIRSLWLRLEPLPNGFQSSQLCLSEGDVDFIGTCRKNYLEASCPKDEESCEDKKRCLDVRACMQSQTKKQKIGTIMKSQLPKNSSMGSSALKIINFGSGKKLSAVIPKNYNPISEYKERSMNATIQTLNQE